MKISQNTTKIEHKRICITKKDLLELLALWVEEHGRSDIEVGADAEFFVEIPFNGREGIK